MAQTAGTSGASVGTIYLNLAVNGANVGSQITQAVNQGAGQALTMGGATIANIVGNLAVKGIEMIVSKAKDAVIKGIDFASDLTETQNVVDTAFGDMAYKAEEFAQTAIDSFGISELSAKQASSTFMAMSKGMGMASDAASDMSINVAKLAADTASFFNLDYDTAQTKLKAIWTGETEGLKSLGVVMTQTNLKAFALQQGIKKDISEMSQAELVTLRYKYVMEQLSLAQGDFVRSEDSWANMTKKLSESWNAFLGKIGTGMIQVLNPFLELLTDIVAELNKFADEMGWGKMEKDAEEAGKNIGDAMTSGIDDAVEEAKDAMVGLLGMDEIQKLTGTDTSSENGSFDAKIDPYPEKEKEKEAESMISKFVKNAKAKWTELKTWISPMWDKIFEVGSLAFDNFKAIGEDIFNILVDFWNKSGDDIKNIIERTVSLATKIFKELFKGIKQFWDGGGKLVFQTMVDIIGQIYGIISDIMTTFGPPLEEFIEDMMPVIVEAFTTLANILAGVLKLAQGLVETFRAMATFDLDKKQYYGQLAGQHGVEGLKLLAGNGVLGTGAKLATDVPKFADGGIVSKPTLAYVGEYTGASNNPEAIAPISDLKDIMVAALRESGYSDDREITIPLTVNLGTKTIVSETVKAINRETKKRNKEVIVTTH